MPTRPAVDLVLRAHALNGEAPGWDDRSNRLFWVDIREPALHRFDPETRRDEAWVMPGWIGCFALADRGAVVALSTGLYLFDIDSGSLECLAPSPFDSRRFIFNDGRCDPQGRFLAGTMYLPLDPGDQSAAEAASPLWRYDGDGRWGAVSPPVKMSNGLAWSPDGRTMYHSDTDPKIIWAHDYDPATGATANRRVFAEIEVEDRRGGPDGASVDSDGFYWCALYANHALLRLDPSGRIERRIPMPVKFPTMPTFGGPDLRTLYITSANWQIPPSERAAHPDEGSLFALEAPASGLPSNRFRLRSTS